MKLINKPAVSVIMAEYNTKPSYLRASIKSILTQTFKDFEFIIIDDGGKNNVSKIASEFNDSRIRIVSNNGNRGLIYSLNNAVKHAKGKFLVRMDTDDIALPNRIEVIHDFITKHPEYSVVGSQAIEFSENNENGVFGHSGELKAKDIFARRVIVHPSVIMRRADILKVGGYDDFHRAEDLALWCKLLINGYKIFSLPETLLRYRVNTSDYQRRKLNQRYGEIKARLNFYPKMKAGPIAYARILATVASGVLPTTVVRGYRSMFVLSDPKENQPEQPHQLLSPEQLKQVQLKAVEVYKAFKKICDENGLRYYAICGTAIGAVRHNGFIPWDDDIDIGMPRKDYEKFRKLASALPKELRYTDLSTDPNSPLMYGKIDNVNTCYVSKQDMNYQSRYTGVFIDIMPLDAVPNGRLSYHIHRYILTGLSRLTSLLTGSSRSIKPTLKSPKTIARYVLGLMFEGRPTVVRSMKKQFVRLNNRYDFDSSKFIARTWWISSHDGMKTANRHHQIDFSSYTEVPFEDTTIRLPARYDRYLTSLFGNYMQPPPKNKQVPRHSGGIIDLEHSYLTYITAAGGKKK